MKAKLWGMCSECLETVECRKDPSGYTVLDHKDPYDEDCLGSGCEPLNVMVDGKVIVLEDGLNGLTSEDGADPEDR